MTQIYSSIDLTQIPANTAGNYLDSNEADDQLGGALSGVLAKTITSADVTLTDEEANFRLRFELSGTMGAPHNLIVPLTKKAYVVINNATQTVTVKTASGTGIAIPAGGSARLWCDGVNVIQDVGGGAVDASAVTFTPATLGDWTGSADPGNADDALDQLADRVATLETGEVSEGGGTITVETEDGSSVVVTGVTTIKLPNGELVDHGGGVVSFHPLYDIGGTFLGQPYALANVLIFPMSRAVTFPAGLTNSKGYVVTAPAADTTFSIQKNGVQFGTMTFAAASQTATFAAASSTSFAAGDVLSVVAPATPDTNLADLGFVLEGTL